MQGATEVMSNFVCINSCFPDRCFHWLH